MIKIKYQAVVFCSHCGAELLSGKEFPSKKELISRWDEIVVSAPLCSPKCKNCKTEGDVNFDVELKVKVTTEKKNKIKTEVLHPKAIVPKSRLKIK